MAVTVTVNAVNYSIPTTGEQNWGSLVTTWIQAISQNTLQPNAVAFTLTTGDLDFGINYGLKSKYYIGRTVNPAASGLYRLSTTDSIAYRNAANSADLLLNLDGSDNLQFNGVVLKTSADVIDAAHGGTGQTSYSIGDMLYASGATALSKLGIGASNFVLTSSGSAPQWGLIVNANVDPAAAIAYSKLALTGSIVNADINASAAIAYSKLALTGSIVNADVNASAAIAYSKLALSNSIVNADINSAAAIAYSKLNLSASVKASDINSQAATAGQVLAADGAGGASYQTPSNAPTNPYDLSNLGLAASVATTQLTIALKQADGTTNPSTGGAAVKIGFGVPAASNGGYVTRSVTAALSIVAPAGASFGVPTVDGYLYVYALDHAGTVELAICGNLLDEMSLHNTTQINASSVLSQTLYSTTSRSNVAIRLLGRVTIPDFSFWDLAPTEVAVSPIRMTEPDKTVRVYSSGGQNISNGTNARVLFDTIDYASGQAGIFGTGSGQFNCGESGIYLFSGIVTFNGNVTGVRTLFYKVGIGSLVYLGQIQTVSTGADTAMAFSGQVKLATGDTFEIIAFQNSGTTVTLGSSASNTYLTISKI